MRTTPLRRPRVVALAAIAGASLLLAGCSGTSSPKDSAPGTAPDISIASVSAPNSMDPAQLVDGNQMYVWASVYDTLLARDSKSGDLIPNAAESWNYNADGTQLTLKLRPGMKFSNGDPVNADAVAKTMLRTKSTPGILQPKYAKVANVTAKDDLTVVVSFTAFDPQFVENLPLGAGAIADPKTFNDPAIKTNPIGSGPYTLDLADSVPGTSYVLKRRADYWDAEKYPFPKVTVRVLQDPTAVFNALQAGELDVATVQPQMAAKLDPAKFTVTKVNAQAVGYLDVLDRAGAKWPALGDKRVRQAINYAINREGILKGIFADSGQTTEQVLNPSGKVYDAGLNNTYVYDVSKGKELVKEAGYAGQTFKIPSTYLTTAVEATLSQAFKDIGLGLEWVPVPPQQAQTALTSGQFGLAYQVTGLGSDPGDTFSHFAPDGFQNPTHYTNPTLDGFFNVINHTVNFQDALPAYKKLNAYAVDEAYEAPIVYYGTSWATKRGVTMIGYGGAPSTLRNFTYNG